MADERYYIEQVVEPDKLFHQTSSGWEVVERFEHDVPIPIEEPVPTDQRQNYYRPTYTRTVIGRVSSFRIRRAVDDPVKELLERVASLETTARGMTQKADAMERLLAEERANHERTRSALDLERENFEGSRKQCERAEQVKRQLEADLGKIRDHIGRKSFEEILPPRSPAGG